DTFVAEAHVISSLTENTEDHRGPQSALCFSVIPLLSNCIQTTKNMSGVNKVILVGRLGKDPEVRNLENGATVANFTMATSETYKDKTTGDRKEITEWHNIVLWRGLADVAARYLHK